MKISLNRILWIMVGIVLLFAVLIELVESIQLRKNLQNEIEKKIVFKSILLDDFFENTFEKIHQLFNSSNELDRAKLLKVRDYFDRMDRDLIPIYREINRDKIFGSYDIFLIDKKRVIRRATLAMDIGLDFHNYPFAIKVFDMIENRVLPYHVSQPMYMPPTNDFRRYFLALSKNGTFYVQISHNYAPDQDFELRIRRIREKDSHIRSLELYFLTNGMINSIGDKSRYKNKEKYFQRLEEDKRAFLCRYAEEMEIPLDIENVMKDPEKIHTLFAQKKLQYKVIPSGEHAVVYSATENIFNDRMNRETIILRMEYDLSDLYQAYRSAQGKMHFVLFIITLVLLLMIYGIKVLLVDRIRRIVYSLKHDEEVHIDPPEIEEFRQLVTAINVYRKKLSKQNRELEILTLIDPLTGAYNRRYFSRMLEEMIYEYARFQKKFALLLFDVDNFKSINDNYGHDVGDEVLVELSNQIRRHIRKNDHFFRIGGEEFALIVSPVEGLEDVVKKAESLRESIARQSFGPGLKVTISIGVSIYKDGDDSVSLFKRVDSYLYRSKKRGKNITTSDFDEESILGPYC